MLLVLTGSKDTTADLIFSRIDSSGFRFNFDIFDDYKIEIGLDHWRITNPVGHSISSDNAKKVFWWKPFNFFTEKSSYTDAEVKYIFREIYSWFKRNGSVRGSDPEYHKAYGKLAINSIAMRHFRVPSFIAGWNLDPSSVAQVGNSVVAKSLTSGVFGSNKVLFTTEVNLLELDYSSPWFLQEKIDAEYDVTVQIVGPRFFAFARDRSKLNGLDWRKEIFASSPDEWQRFNIDADIHGKLTDLAKQLGVSWGRMDFLLSKKELVFLEYNANGQWAFLDPFGHHNLVDEVVSYLLS